MSILDRLRTTLLLAAALAAIASPTAGGQAHADRDIQEISRYRLTDAGLAKYAQATRNLGPLAKGVSDACADVGEDDAGGSGQSLDESVARLDAIGGVRPAIQSAGMTTREYVVFNWSVLQAGLAAWALDQPGGKLPPDVSMDNVTFYRKHEATLRKLGEETKAGGCDEDEGESE